MPRPVWPEPPHEVHAPLAPGSSPQVCPHFVQRAQSAESSVFGIGRPNSSAPGVRQSGQVMTTASAVRHPWQVTVRKFPSWTRRSMAGIG